MGADCKSVGVSLPRFESWTCHRGQSRFLRSRLHRRGRTCHEVVNIVAFSTGEVRQQFSLCFTTRLMGGSLAIDDESTDIAWTHPDDIATLDMHPSMRLRISHYLEARSSAYLG
jgi:hypothetical protein